MTFSSFKRFFIIYQIYWKFILKIFDWKKKNIKTWRNSLSFLFRILSIIRYVLDERLNLFRWRAKYLLIFQNLRFIFLFITNFLWLRYRFDFTLIFPTTILLKLTFFSFWSVTEAYFKALSYFADSWGILNIWFCFEILYVFNIYYSFLLGDLLGMKINSKFLWSCYWWKIRLHLTFFRGINHLMNRLRRCIVEKLLFRFDNFHTIQNYLRQNVMNHFFIVVFFSNLLWLSKNFNLPQQVSFLIFWISIVTWSGTQSYTVIPYFQ